MVCALWSQGSSENSNPNIESYSSEPQYSQGGSENSSTNTLNAAYDLLIKDDFDVLKGCLASAFESAWAQTSKEIKGLNNFNQHIKVLSPDNQSIEDIRLLAHNIVTCPISHQYGFISPLVGLKIQLTNQDPSMSNMNCDDI